MVDYYQELDTEVYLYRRRASDRARERAGRAAWYGDRAGLLIATSAVEALVRERWEPTHGLRDTAEGSAGS